MNGMADEAPAGATDPAGETLAWRRLAAADVPSVWALHRIAVAAAPAPGLVKPESAGFFERMAGEDGETLGVHAGDRLVAYAVLQWRLAPADDPRTAFGLAAETPVAKLAGTSVHPDWRGRGLHEGLILRRRDRAHSLGFRHLYATTAPANWRSWTNLLDAGFAVRALVRKYGSLWRFLLHREADGPAGEVCGLADPADHAAVAARLARGERGVGWVKTADETVLLRFAGPPAGRPP